MPRHAKPPGSVCRLFIDGVPQLKAGDYLYTSGGSAYQVLELRPSPSRPYRRYLLCVRCGRSDIPAEATSFELRWYARPRRPGRRLPAL